MKATRPLGKLKTVSTMSLKIPETEERELSPANINNHR